MHRQGRQQSATDASSTTSVCLIALMYCDCYIIFIMCNVNINLTLQFFFPNFFIIYKILTSPFLGYSCRSALYLRDVHQRDSSACVVSLMSVNKKQSVILILGDSYLSRAKKSGIIYAYGSLSVLMLALERFNCLLHIT